MRLKLNRLQKKTSDGQLTNYKFLRTSKTLNEISYVIHKLSKAHETHTKNPSAINSRTPAIVY